MFDLKDKVAIITGSTKGIGKAAALQLCKAGAKVVISSRKHEECEKFSSELIEKGFSSHAIPCAPLAEPFRRLCYKRADLCLSTTNRLLRICTLVQRARARGGPSFYA